MLVRHRRERSINPEVALRGANPLARDMSWNEKLVKLPLNSIEIIKRCA